MFHAYASSVLGRLGMNDNNSEFLPDLDDDPRFSSAL